MKSTIYSLTASLALLLAACGDDRRDTQEMPPPAQSTPQSTAPSTSSSGSDTAPFSAMETMPPECDMASHDMADMTDEERRDMEADCEAAKRRNSGDPERLPQSTPPR